jgi:hypothetical protein
VVAIAAGGVAFGHSLASGQPPQAATGSVTTVPPRPTPAVSAVIPPVTPSQAGVVKRTHEASPAAGRHDSPSTLVLTDRGGASSVRIKTASGQLVMRGTLRRGMRVTVPQRHVRLVLGNAAAVWISVNGRAAHQAGRSGKVLRLRVR